MHPIRTLVFACLSFFSTALFAADVQEDGSVQLADGEVEYRPEFTAIFSEEKWLTGNYKWDRPVYNLVGWKNTEDKTMTVNLFDIGKTIVVSKPQVKKTKQGVDWTFDHDQFSIAADFQLPSKLNYTVTIKKTGYYTFAYTGAPAISIRKVSRLWQPLVWDSRRLPPKSFLIPDDQCSIPGCLMESKGKTYGAMADPFQFPYEMPNSRNRKFGVLLRNQKNLVQPTVYAPMPDTRALFNEGDTHQFKLFLVNESKNLSDTFETVARDICQFRDQRENTLTTLNQTLENMADFAISEWAKFDRENKSSYYPDAKGTVKNVSCLHPLGISLVMDNPALFRDQAIPIMEYLMSREKFLFATDESGLSHSQKPSMNLFGPAMPVSELAALHHLSGRSSSVFLDACKQLYTKDRKLNMNWVTPAKTWQRSLAMYRATKDKNYLTDAASKADEYIKARLKQAPIDFAEAGDGTFFEYMVPAWKDLYELYTETNDPAHLEAAHQGARRYAQFVWFYPGVPDKEITVNPRGLAPRRGRADLDGLLPVPEETVPAWRVSDQGLVCEGNGTVQRLGILIATHAPYFLRIAQDAGDPFLADIARAAVIGRYSNFPGYHLNTRFSTAQEKPNFPQHSYDMLKRTTSMHYNHILPMTNLLIDYLMSSAYEKSKGAIDFPAEYAEGYAYLQGKIYGAAGGKFYDQTNVYPWMPKGWVKVEDRAINYICGKNKDSICLAFINTSDRQLKEIPVEIGIGYGAAKVWKNNELQPAGSRIYSGRTNISISPKGMTALVIPYDEIPESFQQQFRASKPVTIKNTGKSLVAGTQVEAMELSFGPNLRRFYTYLRSDAGKPAIKSARIRIKFDDFAGEIKMTDTSFPFEFSYPIPEATKAVEFSIEVE